MQKPLAACQGKTVPGAVLLVAVGQVYLAGCRGPWWRKMDGCGRVASDPALRRRRCGVGAGLESEGRHLVLLVAKLECGRIEMAHPKRLKILRILK